MVNKVKYQIEVELELEEEGADLWRIWILEHR